MAEKKQKILSEIAKRIRDARIEARMSQATLGKAIGLSDKSISAYEAGRSTPPINKLKEIARQTKHPLPFFTDEVNDEATVIAKLHAVELELEEIKKLLKKQ